MALAQKPDLVFQRNGRVYLYRRGCQFSRLLAAEVCALAVVMLDRPFSDTVQDCWLPTPFASFPITSPHVLRRVPPDSVSTPTDLAAGTDTDFVGACTPALSVRHCESFWNGQLSLHGARAALPLLPGIPRHTTSVFVVAIHKRL